MRAVGVKWNEQACRLSAELLVAAAAIQFVEIGASRD